MPIRRLSVVDGQARLADTDAPLLAGLMSGLEATSGPVTVMIHGFKYQPGHPVHCPHHTILSRAAHIPDPRLISWPRHLGFRGQSGEGLGVSLGWSARGSIWQAYRRAAEAGDALAQTLETLQAVAPHREVQVIAHSLGARVALRALRQTTASNLRRMILLSAAEYQAQAQEALLSPAGKNCDVLNITSGENNLFDFMMERLVPAAQKNDRMIGQRSLRLRNCVSLQLDDAETLRRLRRAGHPIAAPQRVVCHWSSYLRAGVFPLYRSFFANDVTLTALRALVPQDHAEARNWPGLPSPLQGLGGGLQGV